MLMTTFGIYKNYQHQQQQMSDKNTIVPLGFALIPPRFGENLYETFHDQPQSSIHPEYHEHVLVNHTLNEGFGFENHQMKDDTPLYPQGFLYENSTQQHAMTTSPASQQAIAPQVERFSDENVLVVEVESPILPMSKPRLRWTSELHERFTHAVEELGGYFSK